MFDVYTCPHCKADLSYTVNGERYSRMMGIEIQGGYDGVSYWYCPVCETYSDRFTGEVVDWHSITETTKK
jgi:rubredoxin